MDHKAEQDHDRPTRYLGSEALGLADGSLHIPAVHTAVECIDRGKEIGAPDAYEIEKAVQEGWTKPTTLDRKWKTRVNNLMQRAPVGRGEAEALIIAREKGIRVVLDDADARALARALGIEHMGTVMIPYEAAIKGLIRYDELVSILTDLSKVLWISPAVLAEMFRKAEEGRK